MTVSIPNSPFALGYRHRENGVVFSMINVGDWDADDERPLGILEADWIVGCTNEDGVLFDEPVRNAVVEVDSGWGDVTFLRWEGEGA